MFPVLILGLLKYSMLGSSLRTRQLSPLWNNSNYRIILSKQKGNLVDSVKSELNNSKTQFFLINDDERLMKKLLWTRTAAQLLPFSIVTLLYFIQLQVILLHL